jgi:serine/threonine-protein kinase
MVSENGHVKLLDFGLAKLVYQSFADGDSSDSKATRTIMQAAQTTEGSVLGTVNYMSPEQAEGKPVDARSDLFTFGTVLYEMLSGKLPFKGGSPVATLTAILRDDPPPMTVDPAIQDIVFKCLRKDPADRWQTMRELQDALEAAKQSIDTGMITGVRPAVSAPPPAAPAPKKSPLPLILGGVGAVLALAAGAYFALNRPPQAPPQPLRVEQKPADPAVKDADPADETLDNDSVIEMVSAGLSTNLIISQIRVAKTQFEFSPKEIIRLSKNGVPDVVLAVMRDPKAPLPAGVVLPKDPPASAKKSDAKPDAATTAAKKANEPPPKPGAPEPPPSPVAVATPVNPEPVAAPVAGALKLAVIIPDGTRVRLSLAEAVQRAALDQKNFKVRFNVAEDISVGDQVVIAKGSRAIGTVFSAGQKRFLRMGGGPRSLLILETVDTVDGHQARLRSRVAGAPVPFDVSGLAQGRAKDDPVVVPQGAEIYAYVDGDLSVYGRKK